MQPDKFLWYSNQKTSGQNFNKERLKTFKYVYSKQNANVNLWIIIK